MWRGTPSPSHTYLAPGRVWQMSCHVSLYLFLSGGSRRLNHPRPRLFHLMGFFYDDHLFFFRFAMMAQAVFRTNRLLGCGAHVIVLDLLLGVGECRLTLT